MTDWIGRNFSEFVLRAEKWTEIFKTTALVTAYGFNTEHVDSVMGAIHAFLTALKAFRDVDSTKNRDLMNEAMKTAKAAMRKFATTDIRNNDNVPDAVKKEMYVRVRSGWTVHNPPASQSQTVVENTKNQHEHQVFALQRENLSKAKPDDADAVEYRYFVGDNPPDDYEQYPGNEIRRKTSLIVRHKESDVGKPAHYVTRYVNSKGDKGPWSSKVIVIIN